MPDDLHVRAGGDSKVPSDERQDERRRHLRFPFTVDAEAIEHQTQAKVRGRTSDLSLGGCYIDAMTPFPVGTVVQIRLTKGGVIFSADAVVKHTKMGLGMGVAFTAAAPQQVRIFQKWLNDLSGKSSPEPADAEQSSAQNLSAAAAGDSSRGYDLVLGELILALVRKGVLSEKEGKAMLQKLFGKPSG